MSTPLVHAVLREGQIASVKNLVRVGSPQPPAVGADLLPDKVEASTHSTLRLLVPSHQDGKGQPVVVMEKPLDPPAYDAQLFYGLLVRELVRQAVLLAAREELGLTTRDLVLRETFSDGAAYTTAVQLDLSAAVTSKGFCRVLLRQLGPNQPPKVLWTWQATVPSPETFNYPKLAESLEQQAHETLPGILREAGFKGGRTPVPFATTALPEDVAGQLATQSFVTQFAALRSLHAASRASGESLDLLTGLTRGYANLGVLTEFHWTAAHKVCKARALLYAQRMVSRAKGSALSLRCRAYAEALGGLHLAALKDLEAARKADPPGAAVPEWAELLDAYCRFDLDHLDKLAETNGELGQLLRYLALEDGTAVALNIATGLKLLETNSECFRVVDRLCEIGGVSLLHRMTLQGPATLAQTLPVRLRALPQLPASVAASLAQPKGEDNIEVLPALAPVQALLNAGQLEADGDEPAWSSLGWMVRETQFIQMFRRIDFMRNKWSVPTEEFTAAVAPWYTEHPNAELLERFGQKKVLDRRQSDKSVAGVDRAEMQQIHGLRSLMNAVTNDKAGDAAAETGWRHQDNVYHDLFRASVMSTPGSSLEHDGINHWQLSLACPHSPRSIAFDIINRGPHKQEQLDTWEKAGSRQALVQMSLARWYLAQHRWDDALRCLKRYLQLSPDAGAYIILARIYHETNQFDKWQETLEGYLKQEDYGLDHARVRVELANHFIGLKQYDKAVVYAEAAAETGALWAMQSACQCRTLMKDWDKAEPWIRQASERYPASVGEWYKWCKETGHGNLEAAKRLRDAHANFN